MGHGLKAVLIAIVFVMGTAPSFAQSNINWLRTATVDSLDWDMQSAVEDIGQYANDLGPAPRIGGFCPSELDVFWKFPAGLVNNCLNPTVIATLKTCNVKTSGASGAGLMTGAADCMNKLVSQFDFSKPLDRVAKALPDAISCMSISVVGAAGLSKVEERKAKGVINGVKATYDEYQKLSKLAANLATGGPGVIPDFLAIDASGNDGDNSSLSVGDWLLEADKIAKDPLGYARKQTSDKFKTGIISAAADAVLNPNRTLEDLRDFANPSRVLAETDEMLRHCELPDAQMVWAIRRADLEKKIADARINMQFYRKKTWCQITRGSQKFDQMSINQKQQLLYGQSQTNFTTWVNYRDAKDNALSRYNKFRVAQEEFQNKYNARRAAIAPLLREAADIQGVARANVRKCTGTFVTPRTLNSGPETVEENLNAQAFDLKARMLGAGCSIPMANQFIDGIKTEIKNPYRKWADFLSQAEIDISTGRACSAEGANSLQTNFNRAVQDSFGSIPDMQVCLNTAGEKAVVRDIFLLSVDLENLDQKIALASKHVAACNVPNAKTAIAEAQTALSQLPCGNLSGANSRNKLLNVLTKKLAQPQCGAQRLTDTADPGPAHLIYRVTGSGFVPHYAGGAYVTSGYHDVAVVLEEPPTNASLDKILRDAYKKYASDPCEAQVPAVPGLHKTPVIWVTGPQVEFIYGPAPEAEPDLLENTWAFEEGDGPSLSELLGAACR